MEKIFIAIATCRRNELLTKTITSLVNLLQLEFVQVEVCIGDNDPLGGALDCVLLLASQGGLNLSYVHCPEPGIPQVRNVLLSRALTSNSTVLVFIDDDEVVDPMWLKALWGYYEENRETVHAVHGPVLPLFEGGPSPSFPVGLCGRKLNCASGTRLPLAATGNVLISLDFLRNKNLFFDERMALTGGSDTEFFFRFTNSGGVIHWCDEARVYEFVPKTRMNIKWLCRRSFRCGCADIKFWSLNHSSLYTIFWGIRRASWNFIKHIALLFVVGKTMRYYVENMVKLVKTFGLFWGMLGGSFLEYKERHR